VVLNEWRRESLYDGDDDFVFLSIRLLGKFPLMPDTVLQKLNRPVLVSAGITGKVIGWHSFRHSLVTNLRSMGVDVHPGCIRRQAGSQWTPN
jgi:site-specific recombinase XerD